MTFGCITIAEERTFGQKRYTLHTARCTLSGVCVLPSNDEETEIIEIYANIIMNNPHLPLLSTYHRELSTRHLLKAESSIRCPTTTRQRHTKIFITLLKCLWHLVCPAVRHSVGLSTMSARARLIAVVTDNNHKMSNFINVCLIWEHIIVVIVSLGRPLWLMNTWVARYLCTSTRIHSHGWK